MSVTPAKGSTAPTSIPAAIWVAILRVELVKMESFSQGTSCESQLCESKLVTGVQHNEKIEMKTFCKGGLASLDRGFPPAPSSWTQATGHLPPTPLYFNSLRPALLKSGTYLVFRHADITLATLL